MKRFLSSLALVTLIASVTIGGPALAQAHGHAAAEAGIRDRDLHRHAHHVLRDVYAGARGQTGEKVEGREIECEGANVRDAILGPDVKLGSRPFGKTAGRPM